MFVCLCVCVCVCEREREREFISTLKIFIDFHAIGCEPCATEDRYNIEILVLNLLAEEPRTYFKKLISLILVASK
jgi:hypothetical protein